MMKKSQRQTVIAPQAIIYEAVSKQEKKNNFDYHKQSIQEILHNFETSMTDGLTSAKAEELIKRYGKNKIIPERKSLILKILGYLVSGFCPVLWGAAIVCILAWEPFGEPNPSVVNLGLAGVLAFVALLQASFTAIQDYSSSKIMETIRNMMPKEDVVLVRDGREISLPAEELVIGDLVVLSSGMKVAADMRIIEENDLSFDRSMLTGESVPVEAKINLANNEHSTTAFTIDVSEDKYLEAKNIAFLGTLILGGRGKGIVVSTGKNTEMGKISCMASDSNEPLTTLQLDIKRFVWLICILASITMVIVVIIWASWLRVAYPDFIGPISLVDNLIGLAVSYIPEGLPVAVSLTLMIMAKKMAANKILVKNLTVIETLGCINVLCSDKTGTLTQNKMNVVCIAVGFEEYNYGEENLSEGARQLLKIGLICNNGTIQEANNNNEQRVFTGDATDIAILKFSEEKIGNIRHLYQNICEVPFNSQNKWMLKVVTEKHIEASISPDFQNIIRIKNVQNIQNFQNVINQDEISTPIQLDGKTPQEFSDQKVAELFLKGAPEIIVNICETYLKNDGTRGILTQELRQQIDDLQISWGQQGKRIILVAKSDLDIEQTSQFENFKHSTKDITRIAKEIDDFCLVGLFGLIDPPRDQIDQVVKVIRAAGIRIMMVTGDYKFTAVAIARQVGIFTTEKYHTEADLINNVIVISEGKMKKSLVITGEELSTFISAKDWKKLMSYDEIVFSRVSPQQKVQIVQAFQNNDCIVGVTGDGANDAPALKCANIGISMGSGSQIALEASDMVLLDSNFKSIVVAIELGRLAFTNLRRVILYSLAAGQFAEIVPVLVNVFFGVPLPISSFLMIIICVITDIPPELSMIMEQPEVDLLKLPPRPVKDHLVNLTLMLRAWLFIGLLEAIFAHLLFFDYLSRYCGIQPSNVWFAFGNWQDGYLGNSMDQLNECNYTGQTIYFVALVLMQAFGNLLATRTFFRSFFQAPPYKQPSRNLWMFLAIGISLLLMFFIIYAPFFNTALDTRPIPVEYYFIAITCGLLVFTLDEIRKLVIRYRFYKKKSD